MNKAKKPHEIDTTAEGRNAVSKVITDDSTCRRIPLELSASSIQNNLAVLFDPRELCNNQPISASIGYIHKGSFVINHVQGDYNRKLDHSLEYTVQLAELTNNSHPTHQHNKLSKGTFIIQARWLNMSHGQILLLGSVTGIYFFSADGRKNLGKYDNTLGVTGYSRAATSVGNIIFAGTDSGDMFCFEHDHLKGVVTYLHQKEKLHLSSIQDMHSNQTVVASGDATGSIKVIKAQDFSTVSELLAVDDCITGCILSGNVVIGSYSSGVVRIFDIKSKELQVLIKAHSRWIVSLDINTKQNFLLTVSEDNTARTWKIRDKLNDKDKNDDVSSQPKLVSCITVKNQVLVGGAFIDQAGSFFALSSYAEKQLLICPVLT